LHNVVGCKLFAGQVTFAEFAQYVVDKWSSGYLLDQHWRPQYKICHPCYIKYDFIGRFENLKNDAKYVLTKICAKSERNITMPFANAFEGRASSSHKLRSFYSNVSRDIVKKLIRIYELDYKLFGYDYRWAYS